MLNQLCSWLMTNNITNKDIAHTHTHTHTMWQGNHNSLLPITAGPPGLDSKHYPRYHFWCMSQTCPLYYWSVGVGGSSCCVSSSHESVTKRYVTWKFWTRQQHRGEHIMMIINLYSANSMWHMFKCALQLACMRSNRKHWSGKYIHGKYLMNLVCLACAWKISAHQALAVQIGLLQCLSFSKMHWIRLTGVWSISDPVLEGLIISMICNIKLSQN